MSMVFWFIQCPEAYCTAEASIRCAVCLLLFDVQAWETRTASEDGPGPTNPDRIIRSSLDMESICTHVCKQSSLRSATLMMIMQIRSLELYRARMQHSLYPTPT